MPIWILAECGEIRIIKHFGIVGSSEWQTFIPTWITGIKPKGKSFTKSLQAFMLAVQLWLEIPRASIVYIGVRVGKMVCMRLCEAFNSALLLQAFWCQNKITSEKKS